MRNDLGARHGIYSLFGKFFFLMVTWLSLNSFVDILRNIF